MAPTENQPKTSPETFGETPRGSFHRQLPVEVPLRNTPKCLKRSSRRVHRILEESSKPHPLSILCRACQSIFKLDKFPESNNDPKPKDRVYTPENGVYQQDTRWCHHHASLDDVNRAAFSGCCICRMICQNAFLMGLIISGNGTLQTSHSGHGFLLYRVTSLPFGGSFEIRLLQEDDDTSNKFIRLLKKEMVKAKDFESVTGRIGLSSSTASDKSMDLYRHWLYICKSTHKKCGYRYDTMTFRPSRLICIEGMTNGIIRARLDCGTLGRQNVPYLTLSHCWGAARHLTLHKKNLGDLQTRIDVQNLTKVFQDALWVTLKLGFRYIWIDSLCIIQDSDEDWSKESSLMGEIYMHSSCNIAATGFADGTHGLFVNRNENYLMHPKVYADWSGYWTTTNRKRRGYYYLWDSLIWENQVVQAPLNKRAWVLQERLLSPCVLHFGNRQVFWECFEYCGSESFPRGFCFSRVLQKFKAFHYFEDDLDQHSPSPGAISTYVGYEIAKDPGPQYSSSEDDISVHKQIGSSQSFSDQHGLSDDSISTDDWSDAYEFPSEFYTRNEIWHDIVEAYSAGKLTRPDDKFVAISGVVKKVQRIFDDKYLAGLWQSNFIIDLLWHIDEYLSVIDIPVSYQAPTWSWACLNAEVFYGVVPGAYCGQHLIYSTLLTAEITHATTDDKGKVTAGYARIQGPLHDAIYGIMNTATLLYDDPGIEIAHNINIPLVIILDKPYEYNRDGKGFSLKQENDVSLPIYLLSLISSRRPSFENEFQTAGLIITPTKRNRGEYERIGIFVAFKEAMDILRNPQQTLASELWEESLGKGQYVVKIV